MCSVSEHDYSTDLHGRKSGIGISEVLQVDSATHRNLVSQGISKHLEFEQDQQLGAQN